MQIGKVLLLGSGALKIGEAGEFDYSGTQAIKALKEEGKKVILVNPNVATIQTSKGLADEIYFLPVTPTFVEKIIEKEKPDGILLSFGGQTALNCGIALHKKEILRKHNVEILGTPIEAILKTEDRELFQKTLDSIGVPTAKGKTVTRVSDGLNVAERLGYPVMLRAGFALGGAGSGIAKNKNQLEELLTQALTGTSQVVIEECLWGWKEIEYEVVRDKDNNCITVCNMENFDPVGIHTGDSIVIAPSQTLSDKEYYGLRQIAINLIRHLKIVGECNIQFALNPKNEEMRVIEVNARLSRSSALASKATGYPLAYVAAKLALGKTLPELKNQVTGETSAYFEPSLDYVVVKMPRWDLDKFTHIKTGIGSEMKSVGEVMSIGRSFAESMQKAIRMLNIGYQGIINENHLLLSKKQLLKEIEIPDTKRLFAISAAIYKGIPVSHIQKITGIDPWFLGKLVEVVGVFKKLKRGSLNPDVLLQTKQFGFSDKQIASIKKKSEEAIRKYRKKHHIIPVPLRIDTMAGEFPAMTNYLYMTHNASFADHVIQAKNKSDETNVILANEVRPGSVPSSDSGQARMTKDVKSKERIIVLGAGPYAIGTSVEFDWCAVNTVKTLRSRGYEAIVVNCNPETVSTDFDYSDYLYFEELTLERVLDIYDREQVPIIVSVGGQIPNNLVQKLHSSSVPILGTSPENILKAENRQIFSRLLDTLKISQPKWKKAYSVKKLENLGEKMGFPLLVRPSFVLSGKGMEIIGDMRHLKNYTEHLTLDLKTHPLVVSTYLRDSTEYDFDGVVDNGKLLVWAISEHVEPGGVHSGDSTLMLPAVSLSSQLEKQLILSVRKIVQELKISGPCNIQFLVSQNVPYVIECNIRASRSLPYVSKALNFNFIELATRILLGEHPRVKQPVMTHQTVKAPQFSFQKLRGADPISGVEMGSTGEVAAFGFDVYEAYLKAILSTGVAFPKTQGVFVSLGGMSGKVGFLSSCKKLIDLGFSLYATTGTTLFLKENGIIANRIGKLHEGVHPNCLDLLQEQKIDFAIVTPDTTIELQNQLTDGYLMRRLAVDRGVPIFTHLTTANLFVEAISRKKLKDLEIKPWGSYFIKIEEEHD